MTDIKVKLELVKKKLALEGDAKGAFEALGEIFKYVNKESNGFLPRLQKNLSLFNSAIESAYSNADQNPGESLMAINNALEKLKDIKKDVKKLNETI